jgi:hypothetical protein
MLLTKNASFLLITVILMPLLVIMIQVNAQALAGNTFRLTPKHSICRTGYLLQRLNNRLGYLFDLLYL